jgi:hypothetical protein
VQPEARQELAQPAPRDPASEAAAALARDALHHDRFARGTLYTWTTADQIAELRRSSQLLVRDESPVHGASYLDQILYVLAQRGEPVAKLLYTTAFAKMRFAWHTPWGTRAGWPTEQYGDQLIRVTLKPDALIVSLSAATGVFEARNLRNEAVPLTAVLANPERIAAIYFVSDAHAAPGPGMLRPTTSFREVALCNESMIQSWEVGTDRIVHELATSSAALGALIRYLETTPAATQVRVPTVWATPPPRPRPEEVFAAALALDSPLYRLDPFVLAALVAQLQATPKPRAIEGVSVATFTPGTVRTPPRIVTQTNPTYASYSRPASPTAARP